MGGYMQLETRPRLLDPSEKAMYVLQTKATARMVRYRRPVSEKLLKTILLPNRASSFYMQRCSSDIRAYVQYLQRSFTCLIDSGTRNLFTFQAHAGRASRTQPQRQTARAHRFARDQSAQQECFPDHTDTSFVPPPSYSTTECPYHSSL